MIDEEKMVEANNRNIVRYLDKDGNVPQPPNPAWCLLVNGVPKVDYLLGQERMLLEAYFSDKWV